MRYIFLFILLFLAAEGYATPSVAYDSSTVQPRKFNESAITDYKKQPKFQYDKTGEPVRSLWDRFWSWFWNKIDELWSTSVGSNTVKTIFILLGIGAIVFIIMKMMGDRSGLFRSQGRKGLDYEVGAEDIHSIPFEDAIREALDNENYRLAVRLVYLHSLKLLSDRALIDWKPGKTNSAFIYELKNHPVYKPFNHLTVQFEYAWYGGEMVSKELYREFDDSFKEFKTHIN
jgi:hypothetical protein